MFQIDYYAYANRLTAIHPAEKMFFSLAVITVCLAASTFYTSLAVILLMSSGVIIRAGIPWRFYIKLLTVPAFFLVTGTVAVAVSVSREAGVHLFGFYLAGFHVGVGADDLARAMGLFLKSVGATCCLFFLALTTPMVDIIALLNRLKVPSLFVELMGLIYRFIFVTAETAEKIYISQSSRLGYRSVKTGYISLGSLVSNLLIKSYHRSKLLFIALTSRGYNGELRVLESRYKLSYQNIAIMLMLIIFLILLSVWSKAGRLPF